MDDLISRKAAIDALDKIFPADPMRNDYTQGITCGAALAKEYIKQLPSAQPETHEERTETHSCDLIERQDAIDALHRYFDGMLETDTWSPCDVYGLIEILPSVPPEQLTDKEQRIFLAAMGREEKVCKQVDDECRNCREPYEDSLVRTCHEITRKVKGALWMT